MNEPGDRQRVQITAPPCAVCRHPVEPALAWRCRTCETVAHEECAAAMGGCPRFACPEAATPRQRLVEYLRSRADAEVLDRATPVPLLVATLVFISLVVEVPALLLGLIGTVFAIVAVPPVGAALRRRARLQQPEIPVPQLRTLLHEARDLPVPHGRPGPDWTVLTASALFIGITSALALALFPAAWPAILAGTILLITAARLQVASRRKSLDQWREARTLAELWADELIALDRGDPQDIVYLEGKEEAAAKAAASDEAGGGPDR